VSVTPLRQTMHGTVCTCRCSLPPLCARISFSSSCSPGAGVEEAVACTRAAETNDGRGAAAEGAAAVAGAADRATDRSPGPVAGGGGWSLDMTGQEQTCSRPPVEVRFDPCFHNFQLACHIYFFGPPAFLARRKFTAWHFTGARRGFCATQISVNAVVNCRYHCLSASVLPLTQL
jgi:hypothetical protein